MASATLEHNSHPVVSERELWKGGKSPFGISYGKVMMWYFLISDTFTFASFLITYACLRFAQSTTWPNPAEVFSSIPLHAFEGWNAPLVFVSFMTFLLIVSSYTMVRAVQEGYVRNRMGVVKFLIPTILCGVAFLGCQYLEWTHLISEGMTITSAAKVTKVLNFGQLFFIITGFHGLHVLGGVLLNTWLMVRAWDGTFERRGHYEMVEKLGLYWHFVDLVWVYVFLSFYLL